MKSGMISDAQETRKDARQANTHFRWRTWSRYASRRPLQSVNLFVNNHSWSILLSTSPFSPSLHYAKGYQLPASYFRSSRARAIVFVLSVSLFSHKNLLAFLSEFQKSLATAAYDFNTQRVPAAQGMVSAAMSTRAATFSQGFPLWAGSI